MLAFAGFLIRELYINEQSRSFYASILDGIETRPPDTPVTSPGTTPSQGGQENRPPVPHVPFVDFDALRERYPGVVAWIKLDGSPINYPVMHHTDNDFFLGRLPDGTKHRSGSIYLDYRNSSEFSDKSILIYGHKTHEKEMFGILENYRDKEFYEKNPVIHLYTPERDYEIVVFAVHLAHSQKDHPPLSFRNNNDFMNYIADTKQISLIDTDVTITPEDQIVSLCTCAYDFDDARLIIVGVLR